MPSGYFFELFQSFFPLFLKNFPVAMRPSFLTTAIVPRPRDLEIKMENWEPAIIPLSTSATSKRIFLKESK